MGRLGEVQGTRRTSGDRCPVIPRSIYPELFAAEERPVAIVDLSFRLVAVNEMLAREVGVAAPELVDVALDDVWDVDLDELTEEFARELDTIGVVAIVAGPAIDRPSVPVATLSFRGMDDGGVPVGYTMTFVSDEARRTKRRLSLDAEGFELSFDQIAVGMLLSGMDGYVIKCNPAMVRLFDRSIDEIAETDILSMIHPDDRGRVIEQALQLMTGEIDSYSSETRLLAGDGSAVWVHETATLVRDAEGNPLHYLTQFVDIRDRKRAEEALLKSQSTIRFLFDGIPVPLLQIDAALRICEGNASLAELLGRDPVGLSVAEVVHPDDLGALAEAAASLTTGSDWILDIRVRRPDGTERLVRSNGRIQWDASGTFQSATASWHDITDAKQREDQLRMQATTDPLTALANRTTFLEHVEAAMSAATSTAGVAVLFIDLDKFKPVNDRHGHEAGDQLLCQVARRLRACVRSTDLVARLGGDEFVILVDLTVPGADAHAIGQRVVEHLARPFVTTFGEVSIGVSVGLAQGGLGSQARDVVHRADLAAYEAKGAGGSRLVVAGR